MSQTLVGSDSATSRSDVLPQALVRSWKDCGGEVAWVQMAGELDIATAPGLEQTLHAAGLRAQVVVLDLRELTFTDSCGVHVISRASISARRAGRRLVIVRGPSQTDRIFTLTAADVLEIVDLEPGEPVVRALLQLAQAADAVHATADPIPGAELTVAISAAMVELHAAFCGHHHTTATTYINDKIVACVLENVLELGKGEIGRGDTGAETAGGEVALRTHREDEFCAAIERLTQQRVVAFMSQGEGTPGATCELFFLDGAPVLPPAGTPA